jgi:hypothetical protein
MKMLYFDWWLVLTIFEPFMLNFGNG